MRRDRGVGRLNDEARRSNVCLKGDIRDLNVAILTEARYDLQLSYYAVIERVNPR